MEATSLTAPKPGRNQVDAVDGFPIYGEKTLADLRRLKPDGYGAPWCFSAY